MRFRQAVRQHGELMGAAVPVGPALVQETGYLGHVQVCRPDRARIRRRLKGLQQPAEGSVVEFQGKACPSAAT
uniref:hypothetical protein n=1 Tax=Streptomyces stackebrandtii TaxID=3051177 RepID=UPI0037D9B554